MEKGTTMLTQLFEDQAAELHWLAYLFTGSYDRGLRAFTKALDSEDYANPAMTDFMGSWSRKLVIGASLETIRPQLQESAWRTRRAEDPDPATLVGLQPGGDMTTAEFERALLAIDLFPRCALLLTMFEKLSLDDAALLLNADKALVRKAQSQALLELTGAVAGGRGLRRARPATFRLTLRCVEMPI
jgi:DNA-directed RNA polymerase specialized sigma24 family protein